MMTLPGIDECRVAHGYDEGKEKEYMELIYKDTILREYLPSGYKAFSDDEKRQAMRMCVERSRFRLATVLKLKDTRKKSKKIERKLKKA